MIFIIKNNINSLKRAFRKKAENYIIDENGYLCYKMNIKNIIKEEDDIIDNKENNNNEINIDNSLKNFELLRIPYKIDEFELIKTIHEKINWDDTCKEFLKEGYYYVGYAYDIRYVISKCIRCAEKNKNFFKKNHVNLLYLINQKIDIYLIIQKFLKI